MLLLSLVLGMGLTLAALPARAQTIYKCTLAGKVSYAATPCADGVSLQLATPAARLGEPPASVPAARQTNAAALKQRQAEDQRAAAERREHQKLATAGAALRKKCASLRLSHKWALEDAAGAPPKSADKARIKARRSAEKLALECPG